MANTWFPKGKQALGRGQVDLESDTIMIQAIDLNSYTYSVLHDFLNDIPVGARVGDPVQLQNVSVTDGILNADDTALESLPNGAAIGALIMYQDTTVESTSHLLTYWDSGTNLPITLGSPAGSIPIIFDNGANKISKL